MGADKSTWQFPRNDAGKGIGWRDDGTGLENKDFGTGDGDLLSTNNLGDVSNSTLAAGNLKLIERDTVALLLADTILDYSAGTGKTAVATSQIVKAGGFLYQVAASGASDHHVTTAGGVKLYVSPDSNGAVNVKAFGSPGDGTSDDTIFWQKAIDTKLPLIVPEPADSFVVSVLTIPANHPGIRGVSRATNQIKVKHKVGATGQLFKWDGTNRVVGFHMSGIYFEGNGEGGETYGLDLSGFSYCHFEELYVRLFQLDGIYADGAITPINKQFSNNTFVNVRSNNNERDGIRLDSSASAGNENTANTFIGCETSGNAGRGINELWGEANNWYGHTSQGNTGRNFYGNGRFGFYRGYMEGNAKPVEMGSSARGYDIATRSAFPLWNTFIDAGTDNKLSVMGEAELERHIFQNPYFARWFTATPEGLMLNGSPTLASYTDLESSFGAGLQATVGANFQGLIFALLGSGASLQGQWATLIVEMDTSGIVDPLETRVYARDGATNNTVTGQFAAETLPISAAGKFITRAYDVKFAPTVAGTPTILWYLGYSGVSTGGNIIKIRRAHVIMGQSRKCSPLQGNVNDPIALPTATIQSATMGINIHRKLTGKTLMDTTTGKQRYAIGTGAVSAWRATDGTGDLVPA